MALPQSTKRELSLLQPTDELGNGSASVQGVASM
jgi:hypothetical protein